MANLTPTPHLDEHVASIRREHRDWDRPVINKLSWDRALALAIEAGRIYGEKQHVYRDQMYGWTWDLAGGDTANAVGRCLDY